MDHRLVALLRRQGVQQREGLILLRRQRLEQARTGRLGTHAARSHGEKALLDDGIAQREMMAQEAPSPRVLEARPPEESDEVWSLWRKSPATTPRRWCSRSRSMFSMSIICSAPVYPRSLSPPASN